MVKNSTFKDDEIKIQELNKKIVELEKSLIKYKQTKEHLEKILDNTQDAILIHDLEGSILHVNDTMCKMYGLTTRQEASAISIEDISSSRMSKEILKEKWERVVNNEKLLFEWEAMRPKDKVVFYVEVSLQKILFLGEYKVIANVRNVSVRKEMKKKLKKRYFIHKSQEQRANFTFENIICSSAELFDIVDKAKKAARSSSNILIEGETGTGKELFAHSIHNESTFAKGPFIAINCSAIPNELIESELFGYEKGAYTGAQKSGSIGKFEMANGGTIFLDEIHTMSVSAQMKILRTIEDRTVVKVGGKAPIPLIIRIIVASSENLNKEVEKGNFLSALFYRLNVVKLYIPSLRDRKDDIPLLIQFFIKEMNQKFNCSILGIESNALKKISKYSWPGNIRELKNCIESAFNFCDSKTIDLNSLNLPRIDQTMSNDAPETPHTMEALTKQLLSENLNRFDSVKQAADHLGIPISTFYRKMKKFGLSN